MRYLKHDNDDWLHKAAENYPVQPFGMNWEAVAKELKDTKSIEKVPEYTFVRHAAMIIFFLLLSLICNKYIRIDFDNRYAVKNDNLKVNESDGVYLNKNIENENPINHYNRQLKRKETISLIKPKTETNFLLSEVSNQSSDNTEKVKSLTPIVKAEIVNTITAISSNNAEIPTFKVAEKQINFNGSNNIELAINKKREDKRILTKNRLYAGFSIGPDVSAVRGQKINELGYNAGVIIGYNLHSKWQLETGIMMNRKAYYSSGEYFNAGKLYLPQHAEITSLEGYCNMFEIPINLRYNIQKKNNHQWFGTAGISSYFMLKEDYDYNYIRYGTEYKANQVYKKATNDILSVFNVSLGYEQLLGQKLKLRVEPYYKIPFKGLGSGRLPISSAGMNIGVGLPIK